MTGKYFGRMSFPAQYAVLVLLLSLAMGPTIVFRSPTSESRLSFTMLTGLVLSVYSLSRMWRTAKLLKKRRGSLVRFPRDYWTPLDGAWVAILPSLIGFRFVGKTIRDMHGVMAPEWEFTWGQSPDFSFAAIALVCAIIVAKFYHIVSQSAVIERPRLFDNHP